MATYPRVLGEHNRLRIVQVGQDRYAIEFADRVDAMGVKSEWVQCAPRDVANTVGVWLAELLEQRLDGDSAKMN